MVNLTIGQNFCRKTKNGLLTAMSVLLVMGSLPVWAVSSPQDETADLYQSLAHILSEDYLKTVEDMSEATSAETVNFLMTEDTAQVQVQAVTTLAHPIELSPETQQQYSVEVAPRVNDFYNQPENVAKSNKPYRITWHRQAQQRQASDNRMIASATPVTYAVNNSMAQNGQMSASVQERYEQDPRFYQVYQYIREYNKKLPPYEVKLIARAITDMSVQYQVDHRVVASVIAVESAFRRDAISSSGAIGLGQLKPATATWLGVNNPYDPVDNVSGCAKYISMLSKKYNGNLSKALGAYYQGPGTIDREGVNDAAKHYIGKIQKALLGFAS